LKIPFIVDTLDSVPEHLQEHYAPQEDGRFRLEVENVVEKSKLEEFRDNNISLAKEKASLESQVAAYRALGDDPHKLGDELNVLRGLRQKIDDRDLIDKGGFEKAVEQRVSEMKAAADGQIRALSDVLKRTENERDEARAENRRIMIHRSITDASLTSGALPTAIPDILSRAEREGWTVNDHREVILIRNGEIVFGENGIDPLTPKEWATRHLRDQAPYFFERSAGGGALGSNLTGTVKNPWTKEHWNLSEQGRIAREPNNGLVKAEQMAKAAGSHLGATRPPA
jgi:hypothetical protein